LVSGQTQQFTATVSNTSNTAVSWSMVSGPGSIDANGVYTASVAGQATLKATSVADPTKSGTAILRRGYSFVDGSDGLGRLDAGLFFIAYQRNPETGFVQVQKKLRGDRMNEYIQHTSSAVFACPPGVRYGDDWWGRALFTA